MMDEYNWFLYYAVGLYIFSFFSLGHFRAILATRQDLDACKTLITNENLPLIMDDNSSFRSAATAELITACSPAFVDCTISPRASSSLRLTCRQNFWSAFAPAAFWQTWNHASLEMAPGPMKLRSGLPRGSPGAATSGGLTLDAQGRPATFWTYLCLHTGKAVVSPFLSLHPARHGVLPHRGRLSWQYWPWPRTSDAAPEACESKSSPAPTGRYETCWIGCSHAFPMIPSRMGMLLINDAVTVQMAEVASFVDQELPSTDRWWTTRPFFLSAFEASRSGFILHSHTLPTPPYLFPRAAFPPMTLTGRARPPLAS